MDYPITQAITKNLLAGFFETNRRDKELEDTVAAELDKLPADRRHSISTEDIFANAALFASLSRALRMMMSNPAFKIEPVISQLRRAEGRYIAAHDAFLKDSDNGRRIEEMRWAHARLKIVRQFYDGVLVSLPPKKRRALVAHPVVGSSEAVKKLRLADFSDEEQRALRLAITNREAAIESVDQIIAAGQESSKDLRIIHAYLIDPDAKELIERWLVDQSSTNHWAEVMDRPTTEGVGAAANTTPASAPTQQPAVEAAAPTGPSADVPADAATTNAVAVIDVWLSKLPVMLDRFVKVDALWQFDGEIKAQVYAKAYKLAVTSAEFQRMIDVKKSARLAVGDVPVRKS